MSKQRGLTAMIRWVFSVLLVLVWVLLFLSQAGRPLSVCLSVCRVFCFFCRVTDADLILPCRRRCVHCGGAACVDIE